MSEQNDEKILHLEALENHPSEAIAHAALVAKQAAIAYRDGKKSKTFDWIKAVSILKANNIKNADAGLIEDWSFTAGTIIEDRLVYKSEHCGAYFHSTWATPGLFITRADGTEEMIECWCYAENATWDIDESWPELAREEFKNKPHVVTDAFGNEIEIW